MPTPLRRPGSTTRPIPGDVDAGAIFHAMDAARVERGLSWPGVAKEIWDQSVVLPSEAFVDGPHSPEGSLPLPGPGPERRLRWDLRRLCAEVDTRRAVSA